tara:strand:+ start:272 stop:1783 length:1512 start_codon:yes stop_codon:yes gene_type:complete
VSVLVGATHEGVRVDVTTERLEGSLVKFNIEVDDERFESEKNKAIKRIAQKVKIPGFRSGKAPRKIIEKHVGPGLILQEAIETLLPDIYQEVVETEEIEVIDQPDIELVSTEPFVFSATVPVRPEIDLGDYKSIRVSPPEVEVTNEERDSALTELRRRFAMLEPVDRPIKWGDTIRADVKVEIEGEEDAHEESDAEFAIRESGVVLLPGFAEELIGRERGGPEEFTSKLPDDLPEDLAGKEAKYVVSIHEVKQEILPDADDEFAVSLDDGFETLDEVKERINEDLTAQKDAAARNEYHNELVDLLIARATVDFPVVLVDREIDRQIDVESNHASHTEEGLQQWLEASGQEIEEVRARLRDSAEQSVKSSLILGQLALTEKIEIDEQRVSEEIETLVRQMAGGEEATEDQLAAIHKLVDTAEGRASISNRLLTQMTLERLEVIATDAESDSGEDDSDKSTRTSRRSRSRRAKDKEKTVQELPEVSQDDAMDEVTEQDGEPDNDP